jgi:predicted cobalt transporter CbtA
MTSPPFRKQRTPLLTDRVSRSAAAAATTTTTARAAPGAAAAAAATAKDEEEYHPAEAFPPTSTKPSGAITALSKKPAVRRADAYTTKTLDL